MDIKIRTILSICWFVTNFKNKNFEGRNYENQNFVNQNFENLNFEKKTVEISNYDPNPRRTYSSNNTWDY